MTIGSTPHISLFEMTLQVTEHTLPMIRCSKKTLVHISHTLENIILENRLPAMMFTGFQESSHWAKETQRYFELANVAQQVCIFAGKPLPADQPASILQVELAGDDPLRQEWFVIIVSDSFSVLLTGKDRSNEDEDDGWRTFDTILSFDYEVINPVLDALEGVLAHYRPDLLEDYQQVRRQYTPLYTNPVLLSGVITELVSFEEALNQNLRRERDFNRQLIDTMHSYSLTLTQDGRIHSANPALCERLGITLDELIHQPFWERYFQPEKHALLHEVVAQIFATGGTQQISCELLTPLDVREIEWQLTRIDAPNQPPLLFMMGHDVTDMRLAETLRREEDVLRAQLEKERQLSELRSQFITTVSHEFRTPLSTILNNAQMIERGIETPDEALQRRVNKIIHQVNLINTMVDEISTLVHASGGNLTFSPQHHDIDRLTQRIIDGVRAQLPRTEDRIHYKANLTQTGVLADSRLLQFILSNLLGNALKYSPIDQPITITLRQENDNLIYEVSDRGDGIPPEDRARLFEAFYRGSNVGQTRGTGLGLRIVRDCVMIYGGSVTYRTGDDGTTFIVRLPMTAENQPSDQ